ncbi:MAG: ankyrin repeat domain-containing protein [Candidatus Babeliales bacterium]|jgi:hypothetical protein
MRINIVKIKKIIYLPLLVSTIFISPLVAQTSQPPPLAKNFNLPKPPRHHQLPSRYASLQIKKLFNAITPKDSKTVKTLITKKDKHLLEVREDGENSPTPLIYAVIRGNPKIVEYLLKMGADTTKTTVIEKEGEFSLDGLFAEEGTGSYTALEIAKALEIRTDYASNYKKIVKMLTPKKK